MSQDPVPTLQRAGTGSKRGRAAGVASRTRTYAIGLAAGSGTRMGFEVPKQFMKLAGRTVIEHTLDVFERHSMIDEVFIIVDAPHRTLLEEVLLRNAFGKVTRVLNGGATRRESSSIGVNAIPGEDALVLLHDAVRPFLGARVIRDCIEALEHWPAVDVAIPAVDTIIDVDSQGCIDHIPRRE
ncbi:MAG: 2-C-methyl-D-erythritol 4-phosphate cytidylyltransferase, partial [Myxococcota bacterium]|nr:2-C-methyl-D-erythritol 4-phosphate cytidylyltransferase [Myxococcota bacterium]